MKKTIFWLVFAAFALLELSIYPFKLPILGTVVFVPFFLLIDLHKKPFLLIYLIGVLFFAANLYFVAFIQIAGYEKFALIFGYILLVLYESVFYGLWGWLYSRFHDGKLAWLLAPSIWVVLEYVRSVTDLGFPWLNLWMTTAGDLSIAGLASVIGPYGVSWSLVFTGYIAYKALREKSKKLLAVFLAVVVALHIIGYLSVRLQNRGFKRKVRVAVIQPDILPTTVYNPAEWWQTVKAFNTIMDSLDKDSFDIIILSESAFPGFYRLGQKVKRYVHGIVRRYNAYILFGSAEYDPVHIKIYNSAFLVDPNGKIVGLYSKNHLVPFGEHLPFEDKLKFLRRINLGQSDYSPGGSFKPLSFDGVRMGIMICFESMFPEISRKEANLGADMLVVMTNDGWFGKTVGPVLHYEHARFRAIETGRYIVRSAKTGISAIIAPDGSTVTELPLFKAGYFVSDVPLRDGKTIYMVLGDFIVWLSFIIVALAFAYFAIMRRRKRSEHQL